MTEMSWQPIYDEKGASLGHRESIRDVTARREAEEALKRAEHEKATILDSLAEGVIHYDRELIILWANQAACNSAKMKREELIGKTCRDLCRQDRSACDDCPVAKALQTGQSQEAERRTHDGKVWFIQGSPIRNEHGVIIGAVEIALEFTHRGHIEQSMLKNEDNWPRLAETHDRFIK